MEPDREQGNILGHCLIKFCSLFHIKVDLDSVLSGLPLPEGELTPAFFERAARRAGLKAKIETHNLFELSGDDCPVILLLDGDACILLSINPEAQEALIWKGEEQTVSFAELKAQFSGFIIRAAPSDEELLKGTEADNGSSPGRSGSYRWFKEAVRPYWRIYRDVLLASFLVNFFALVSPLFVMNVYDRVVPNNAVETLWMLALGVVLAFVFDFLLKIQRSLLIDYAGKQIDVDISASLIEKVLGLQMSKQPASTGSFVNNLNEFESIRSFITSACITTLIDLPFVILFLGVVFWIGGLIVVIPIVTIMACLTIAWFLNKPLQQRILQNQQVSAMRQGMVTETLQGLEAIKTSRSESGSQHRWEKMTGFLAKNSFSIRKLQTLSSQSAVFLLQLNTVLLVIAGVYLIGSGDMSMGGLIAVIMVSGRCAAPVSQLIGLLNQYERARQSLDQSTHIMTLPQEREEQRTYLRPAGLQGYWRSDALNFAYDGQPPLLQDIHFTLNPGEKIGVLGRMGSGKTSLARLLMGLLQPSSGSLSVDSIDLHQLDPACLRRHIGYVPQRISIFSGTIRDNILLGNEQASDDEVLRVARLSGLGELVSNSDHGLDFQAGEGGRHLSGGQIQAIGIARALIGDPQVLILDEPTSAMDTRTEAQVCESLQVISAKKTLILITHRLSLLMLVNRVIVLEKGRIVADGPADELVHNQVQATTPAGEARRSSSTEERRES